MQQTQPRFPYITNRYNVASYRITFWLSQKKRNGGFTVLSNILIPYDKVSSSKMSDTKIIEIDSMVTFWSTGFPVFDTDYLRVTQLCHL